MFPHIISDALFKLKNLHWFFLSIGVMNMVNPDEKEAVEVISYRIENVIDFFPSLHIVRNINTGGEATLFMPASRCLVALIERQGQVINQKELMDAGWESVGMSVSSNAYYQNISNIRRAFKIVTESDALFPEILTTIKRTGLLIDEKISIVTHHECQSNMSNEFISSSSLSSDRRDTFRNWNALLNYFAATLSLFLIAGFLALIYNNFKSNPYLLSNYTLFKITPTGCHIYLNNDSRTRISDSSVYDYKDFQCHGYQNAYLTRYQKQTRTSVLYCSNNSGKLACLSYYYASHHNEG